MNKTTIEWTETTWNPVTGCSKISEGCKNCYAEAFAHRLKAMGNPRYINEFEVTIHRDLFEEPLKWKKPRRIFVNSMSDLFHEELPDDVILRIFETMNKAHWHTFQVLTKRSERVMQLSDQINWTHNIWMGVSVEDTDNLYRIDNLRQTGAKIKFISAEPLLSSLNEIDLSNIDWLIVGGESGRHCRPIEEDWVRELRDKAKTNNTPFFFKQWGGFNKKKNGKTLDGKIIQEYPKN